MDFQLLRLVLALQVTIWHFAAITGEPLYVPTLSATVAVQTFFVVSGWIVTASFRRDPELRPYFTRRAARLLPLYAVVVLVQTVLVAVLGLSDLHQLGDLMRYLLVNLIFLNFLDPNPLQFFAGAPVEAVNPSLWTLKIEVAFYLMVPLLVAWGRRIGHLRAELLLLLMSTAYAIFILQVSEELARQLPVQLRFFAVGMLIGRLHDAGALARVPRGTWLLSGVVGLYLTQVCDDSVRWIWLQAFNVGAMVLGVAALSRPIPSLPDISYGVYLIHAPVMQFGRHFQWLQPDISGLAMGLAVTIVLAWLAHVFIERPAMQWCRQLTRRSHAETGRTDPAEPTTRTHTP